MGGGILLGVALICSVNFVLGWRWSELRHNPWAGRPFGGLFYTPAPGVFPARLSVEEINSRGRNMMIGAPIISTVTLVIFLIAR
jgi:hypothetical protein